MAEAHNPLAQFDVYPLIPLKIGGLDLSFTNASMWMVIAVLGVTSLMFAGVRSRQLVPGRWQSISEILVEFVTNIVSENAGNEALKFFTLIFTLFMFILFSNHLHICYALIQRN